ncbi:8-oxo-dGTP diphosphatase [Fibrobacterota bacterium]
MPAARRYKYLLNNNLQDVSQVDWQAWVPDERAVLCFVEDGDRVMLIHKKTGLGAGKINAPGGRIKPGESAEAAAIRETIEETGITPSETKKAGELSFIFTNGYALHGEVFFASSYSGSLITTPEADPFWCDKDKIPYDKMWEDDRYWLPLALEGKYFRGFFIFDDEVMLSHRIEV